MIKTIPTLHNHSRFERHIFGRDIGASDRERVREGKGCEGREGGEQKVGELHFCWDFLRWGRWAGEFAGRWEDGIWWG